MLVKGVHFQKEAVLDVCRRALLADRAYFLDVAKGGYSFVLKAFLHALADPSLSLRTKGLSLLASLLQSPDIQKDVGTQVKAAVDHLLVYSFPSRFKDLPKGTPLFADLQICLEALLDCLQASRSVLLLKCLLPLMRYQDEDHPFALLLTERWKSLTSSLSSAEASEFFHVAMIEGQDISHTNQLRLAITQNLSVPDRKSTRLNSSHRNTSRMPSSA